MWLGSRLIRFCSLFKLTTFGDGSGVFKADSLIPIVPPSSTDMVADDFNDDGVSDLVIRKSFNSTFGVSFGKGDGSFFDQVPYLNSRILSGLGDILTADFDKDGIKDIIVNDRQSEIVILKGLGMVLLMKL